MVWLYSVAFEPEISRLPLAQVTEGEGTKGFIVAKLFVGVSNKESLPSPADTEKLLGVKSFPLPDLSLPIVVAVAAELSDKSKWNPFVPYVPSYFLGLHIPVWKSVYPKLDGVSCCPSTKLISAKYPSKSLEVPALFVPQTWRLPLTLADES